MESLDEKLAAFDERCKERKPRIDAEEAARDENRQRTNASGIPNPH